MLLSIFFFYLALYQCKGELTSKALSLAPNPSAAVPEPSVNNLFLKGSTWPFQQLTVQQESVNSLSGIFFLTYQLKYDKSLEHH